LVTRTCIFAILECQFSLAIIGWPGAHPSTLAGCTVSVAPDASVVGAAARRAADVPEAALGPGCCPPLPHAASNPAKTATVITTPKNFMLAIPQSVTGTMLLGNMPSIGCLV
jgi:hypothetical protein